MQLNRPKTGMGNISTMEGGVEGARFALLHNLKTGNIIIDMFLSLFVCSMVNFVINSSPMRSLHQIRRLVFGGRRATTITLHSSETRTYHGRTQIERSPLFVAVLLHIRSEAREGRHEGLHSLSESYDPRDRDADYVEDRNHSENKDPGDYDEAFLIASQHQPFRLTNEPDVWYRMMTETRGGHREGTRSNEDSELTRHSLVVESDVLDIDALQKHVEKIHKDHTARMQDKCHKKLHVFVYEGVDSRFNLVFKTYPFHTTCSMDTMFFDNKDEVLRQVDFFVHNRDWYEKRGKPWTLGICTHGEPGCGKTTFEKALCRYLDRHMIIVDISRIQSQQEADRLFFSPTIAGRHIPYDRRMYVFPDVDRQSDLLYSQDYRGPPVESKSETSSAAAAPSKDVQDLAKLLTPVDRFEQYRLPGPTPAGQTPLNQSKILNLLDGVPERTGQVVVMSANHPERLDNALTRPGRIDCKVLFDRASAESAKSIVDNFFQVSPGFWEGFGDYTSRIDRACTPAEVFQICSSSDSPATAVRRIASRAKVE